MKNRSMVAAFVHDLMGHGSGDLQILAWLSIVGLYITLIAAALFVRALLAVFA